MPLISFAEQSTALLESLDSYDTIEITENNGELVVALNIHRVSLNVFYGFIDGGFCILAWLNERKAIEKINKVTVLNRHKAQGYILENGVESCDERAKKIKKSQRYF